MVNAISVTGLKMTAIRANYFTGQGSARDSDKEFLHYLQIARSSAVELDTQLIIAKNIGYIKNDIPQIDETMLEILKMLSSLITKVKSRVN